jgi:hypothetical protein
MSMTVDQAAQKIHSLVHDDGTFGTSRNEHMHEIQKLLGGFSGSDVNKIVGKLSAEDLKGWASDINSGGIWGRQGLSGDEKRGLMNEMAKELDGAQLGRLSGAFNNRGDVLALGNAVSQFSSADTKVAYVKALAPSAADRESKFESHFGSSTVLSGDKEAYAIGQVLTSLKGNGAAFNEAMGSLNPTQLGGVVKALENERLTTYVGPYGGASISPSFDPAPLKALLEAGAASGSTDNKAKLFQAAAKALPDIRGSDSALSPNFGAKDQAATVAQGLTKLLDSDVRGITDRLNTTESSGKSIATYVNEVLSEDKKASNGIIGRQLAQLQGAGSGMTAKQYFGVTAHTADGKPYYRNAQTLGYYSGAVQAGINKMTSDAKTQAEIAGNIFSTVVAAGATALTKLPVSGKLVAGLFGGGISKEVVRQVTADVAAGNKSLRDAFAELALPRDAGSPDRYRGPAEPYYQGTENTVILRNQ